MQLLIVESPTKARTLSKFLGKDIAVEATMGHLMDLPKSKLGVDVDDNFKPQFELVEKRKDVVKKIKSLSKKADKIFLATDPDREGEAISFYVKEILSDDKKKEIKRIAFHEITKEAVDEAIANPGEININLVEAQTARRVLDRLVGYKLSPLLWKKVRRGLSAGRVQTVTVRLIVEKEREIEAFRPVEYWEIFAKYKNFTAQLIKEVGDGDSAKKIVEDLKKLSHVVSEVRKREVKKSPYPPFTTSTMQQAGSRLFGWSSKKTMQTAQKLYEEGLITYHRTDSVNLAKVALDQVRGFIKKEYGDSYLPESPRFYKKQSKVAQEAHEAIRPTDVSRMPNGENKLYDLIWKRFVACQMNNAVYSETTINVLAGDYKLRASGQIMIFDGWRKLFSLDNDAPSLPEVKEGDKLELTGVDSFQKFTLPPARYNEASLIKTLEGLGIGRPSTYAPTISTIQVRQYVEKNENKQFVPTSVGIAVNDFLIPNFPDVFEYAFTAQMEDELDGVANGNMVWSNVIKDFYKPFDKKLVDVEKNSKRVKIEVEKLGKPCPECKEGELVIRTGRFGKFISCSRFPDCKYTEKFLEKVGVKCPECKEGDLIVKKSKRGRKFFGCSRYPNCKFASWKLPGKDVEK